MGRRIDYLDDPDAPAATSMVPSVNVLSVDEHGRVLMICRSDNGNWALPGGAIDLGESARQAGVRETREETGIDVEVTGLVGVYTNPGHRIEYTSNGEVRQECSIVLTARPTGGSITTSSESSQVAWIDPAKFDELWIHPSMRQRINHWLTGDYPHVD